MTHWRHVTSNGDRGHPSLPRTWKQWLPATRDEKMPQGRQCAVCGAEPVEYNSRGEHSQRLHRTHDEAEHTRWRVWTAERFAGGDDDTAIPPPVTIRADVDEVPAPVGEPGLFDDDSDLPF